MTTASFTLTLLVMVVIGGTGTRWGALLGGFLYTLADQRLGDALAARRGSTICRRCSATPLSEPLFILGTLFILLVFFVPGGLASIGHRALARTPPAGAAGGDAVKIAWERHGQGAPLLLIQGLGYARWGWEPVVEPLARSFDVILFDNRGIGESDTPPGPYTAARAGRATRCRCSTRPASSARTCSARASAAWSRRSSRSPRPSASTGSCSPARRPAAPESFPMPEQTVKLLTSGATLRQFVENALAPGADEELVERILRHREATAQPLDAWSAQAAAGAAFDALDRVEAIAAPTLILHGTEDTVVDSRNTALLAVRIPDARVELFPGGGHLFFWEQPDALRRGRDGVPRMSSS